MIPEKEYGLEEFDPATWNLLSFTINHDLKPSGPRLLYLDRANGEFGIVSSSASAVTVLAQYPDDEPIYFQGKIACAASWRAKCKKVTLLFKHSQVDLEFAQVEEAHGFLHALEDIAMAAGNHFFYSYEVPLGIPFVRADFDMKKHGCIERTPESWMAGPANDSEWSQLRQTGEWSDFTVVAEGKSFPVHRVRLCKESQYFKAVCSGGFAESARQSISLPESAQTVSVLLDEVYDTYNSTTGSIFTSFALRPEIEKERTMAQLLDLFVASDKYNLEKLKRKVSNAIIDRLSFVKDPLMVVDMATNMHHCEFPYIDNGLREAIVAQIDARLPAIIEDEGAWGELVKDNIVLRALHVHQCDKRDDVDGKAVVTPPCLPVKGVKNGRAQDRCSGG